MIGTRWRYALPQVRRAAPGESFWWSTTQGLGVCGDFLGGRGAEGAWLSAQALCAALLRDVGAPVPALVGRPLVHEKSAQREALW